MWTVFCDVDSITIWRAVVKGKVSKFPEWVSFPPRIESDGFANDWCVDWAQIILQYLIESKISNSVLEVHFQLS